MFATAAAGGRSFLELRVAAARVRGVYILDTYSTVVQDRILTGSGRVGNLQNNGTADRLVSEDNVHPSLVGHAEWGAWSARQIYAQALRGIRV